MTKESFKHGVIKAVLVNLEKRNIKPSRVEYLKSIKDVDKAYIIANRYIRTYLKFDNKKERLKFFKVANDLGDNWEKNGNKWLDEDNNIVEIDKPFEIKDLNVLEIVNESNEEFLSKIEMADKSIIKNSVVGNGEEGKTTPKLLDGSAIITMILENKVLRLEKSFMEKISLKKEFIGEYNGSDLYFCENLNCLVGII
jgi:hypothetical protein